MVAGGKQEARASHWRRPLVPGSLTGSLLGEPASVCAAQNGSAEVSPKAVLYVGRRRALADG